MPGEVLGAGNKSAGRVCFLPLTSLQANVRETQSDSYNRERRAVTEVSLGCHGRVEQG